MRASTEEIKHKLRELKKLEKKIRRVDDAGLVWNDFFRTKYPPENIAAMDRTAYKKVVEEYFYYVYYKFYTDNPASGVVVKDPAVLARLGLLPDASDTAVKAKFRELAKIHHPDAGGSGADFVRLIDDYKRLK